MIAKMSYNLNDLDNATESVGTLTTAAIPGGVGKRTRARSISLYGRRWQWPLAYPFDQVSTSSWKKKHRSHTKQMQAIVSSSSMCVCVCDPHIYPFGRTPSFFLFMFVHLKSDKKGEGGPRAVGRAPSLSPNHFCGVLTLFEYFRAHPGRRETLVLLAHGPGVTWSEMTLCHLAAAETRFDPTRLVPHAWRAGAQAQLEDELEERRPQDGGWKIIAGWRDFRYPRNGPFCDPSGLVGCGVRASEGVLWHDSLVVMPWMYMFGMDYGPASERAS